MTAFDYIVLGIVFISALLGITRGFVREVLSLLAWVIPFFVASRYSVEIEPFLSGLIEDESIRMLVAFTVTFFAVLLLAMLGAMQMLTLVKSVGLGLVDRMLGAIFGFACGLVFVMFLVLAAGFTTLPQQPFWQQAVLSKPLEIMAADIIPWLPQDFRNHIGFGRG